MKKLLISLLIIVFAVTTTPPVSAQKLPVELLDRIAAVVDEDVVLQSELDRAVKAILAQYASDPQKLPPRDVLEHQVLERLIMMKLQLARAASTSIKVSDAEIDQALAQVAQQNKMEVSQLRQAVQQQGLSFDQFRKNLRDELLVQRLRQRVTQGHVQVSDAEIDSLIKAGGAGGAQLHLAHILIGLPEGATPVQIDAAHKKADEVKHQVDEGMDFSAAAIRFSQAQNALEGGDLGWRKSDEMPKAFSDIIGHLNVGDVTPPIHGPNGFYILKLIDKRDAGQQMVTEVRARHILIKVTELVSSEQAQKNIENIRNRLVAGEDFEKLAKEFSEDTATANLGGDMGWFTPQAYGTRVAEALKNLKENEISQTFQTEVGFHIVQLLGQRTQDKTADIQRAQAKQQLFNRKAEEEYENFLRQIHSEAYIDIRLPSGTEAAKP